MEDTMFDPDTIIHPILEAAKEGKFTVHFAEDQLKALCAVARDTLAADPSLLELQGPLTVVGDVKGQLLDVVHLLSKNNIDIRSRPPDVVELEASIKEEGLLPHDLLCHSAAYLAPTCKPILFLGNYCGSDSRSGALETLCLLLACKVKFPSTFHLLRGHQDDPTISRMCGIYHILKQRYNVKTWKKFCEATNMLPVAATVRGNGKEEEPQRKIFCVHGGLSPELTNLDQICAISRPFTCPDQGLITDLLWSDPAWADQTLDWVESDRGVSYTFSRKVAEKFMSDNEIALIIRGHQLVQDGYSFEFQEGPGGQPDRKQPELVMTLYSAPCALCEHDNLGATVYISADLKTAPWQFTRRRTGKEIQEE